MFPSPQDSIACDSGCECLVCPACLLAASAGWCKGLQNQVVNETGCPLFALNMYTAGNLFQLARHSPFELADLLQ